MTTFRGHPDLAGRLSGTSMWILLHLPQSFVLTSENCVMLKLFIVSDND